MQYDEEPKTNPLVDLAFTFFMVTVGAPFVVLLVFTLYLRHPVAAGLLVAALAGMLLWPRFWPLPKKR